VGRPTPLLAPAAGFWRRAAAFAIDWTLMLVLAGIAAWAVSAYAGDPVPALVFVVMLWLVAPVLLAFATAAGGTIGRRACGLAVVRVADGERAGLPHSLRREVVGRSLVSTPLLLAGGAGLLGYAWAPRDRLGQTWHDHVGRTTVLDVRRRPALAAGPAGPRFVERRAPAPGGYVYAQWWPRFGAWLIDQSLVLTVSLSIATPIGLAFGLGSNDLTQQDTGATVVVLLVLLFQTIGVALYNAVAIGWREATVGKHAVGLIVRAADGARAGYRRAFTRELLGRILVEGLAGVFVLFLAPLASGLAAAADRRRQTWHDQIGQTIVVEGRGERRRRAEHATIPEPPDTPSLPAAAPG
jgi:uncharacterized RDD family membrane protein YckC